MSTYQSDPMSMGPEQLSGPTAAPESEAHAAARKRVQARRDLANHAIVYVVVNAFFVGVWWFTGADYFWPAWVIGGWGIGLALNAWEVLFRRPITEAEIEREMHRGAQG